MKNASRCGKISFIYRMNRRIAYLFALTIALSSCNDEDADNSDDTSPANVIAAPTLLSFQAVNQFPHDTASFTEGFSFYNGQLYESTGSPDMPANNGTWIGTIDLATGAISKKVDLGKTYFGEGTTFFGDKIYQLTYTTKKGFVYDAKTFKKLREFKYEGEGWGLTNDGTHLIMSNGTSNIYYLTPDSLNFVKMLPVQDNNGYVSAINELEFIDGYIYANQWLTPNILKIDPATGYVVGKLDLSQQIAEVKGKFPRAEEANGIAYDSISKKTYITGKKWPLIYEIKW